MTTANLSPGLTLDSDTDDLRPVGQLVRELTGRRPAPATVWRWCRRGNRRNGVLPGVVVMGRWHTTREAYLAWIRRGTERPLPAAPTTERDEATERALRERGLID